MATEGGVKNEAARRVMTSLYGSEAAATEAAQALSREITPKEEVQIKRMYDAADEDVDKIFKDAQKRH